MALKNFKETKANKVELTVVIDRAAFEVAVNNVFRKNVKKITVPGFRRGKATRGIIESYYGKGVFYEDALNEILPGEIAGAVEETKFVPCDTPSVTDVDFDAKDGILVKAEFIRRPDVKLGEYKGFKVTKNIVDATDADVESELEAVRKRNARVITVSDRAAADGDIADIDYEGFVDGVAFAGGKDEGHKLTLGSKQFIPGFEEQIVGKSVGEQFDITVKFPEDYHAEELKGKEAVFKIKLNGLEKEELPALDDEFAKDVSEFDTIAEYKADIKAKIEKRNLDDADMRAGEDIAEQLCGIVEADIPAIMYEKETDLLVREYDMNLRQQGLSLEMLMKYTGMKMEDIRARYSNMAISNVKKQLALAEIVKLEKVVADDAKIEARYEELATQFGMKASDVKARIDIEDIRSEVETLAAFEIVKNAAKVTEKHISAEELNEIIAKKQGAAEEKKPAKKEAKKTSAKASASTKKTAEKAADEKAPAKSASTKKAAAKSEDKAEPAAKSATKKTTPVKKATTTKKTAEKAEPAAKSTSTKKTTTKSTTAKKTTAKSSTKKTDAK